MPAFLTHCIFAEKVLEDLDCVIAEEILSGHRPLYRLGAQGPDIFFFYKSKPWVRNDGIEKLGLIMHDKKTADFFIECYNFIKSLKDEDQRRKPLLAYLFGYICHFALDSTTHPFIHYFAGVEDDSAKDRKYHNFHKKLESIIDVYYFVREKGIKAHRYRASSLIIIDQEEKKALADLYRYTIKKVYNTELSDDNVKIALSDISSVLDLLFDPYSLKFFLFRIFEVVFGQKGDITYFMTPRKIPEKIDFLNLQKRKWSNPCDHAKVYDFSFPELLEQARRKAVKMIEETYNNFSGIESPVSLEDIFKKISYSTGEGYGSHAELKYFQCIFDGTEKRP